MNLSEFFPEQIDIQIPRDELEQVLEQSWGVLADIREKNPQQFAALCERFDIQENLLEMLPTLETIIVLCFLAIVPPQISSPDARRSRGFWSSLFTNFFNQTFRNFGA